MPRRSGSLFVFLQLRSRAEKVCAGPTGKVFLIGRTNAAGTKRPAFSNARVTKRFSIFKFWKNNTVCVGVSFRLRQVAYESISSLCSVSNKSPETVRLRLFHCNSYHTVIKINITKNKISCNRIIITIYQFGDNTWIEP